MREPTAARIALRRATQADCRRLWEWRNEPATREASFDTSYIPYEDHERWFSRKIHAQDTQIFVILDANGHEVGYVRFNIVREEAEISVSVDQAERDKGYGPAAIQQGSAQLLASGSVKWIVAYIKPNNPASVAAFQRAGFIPKGTKEVAGTGAYVMAYGQAHERVHR